MDANDPMYPLMELVARAAWQPSVQTAYRMVQRSDGTGSESVPEIVTVPSPLLQTIATELAKMVSTDGDIREIFLSGLRGAILTPEWMEQMRRVLPEIALKEATHGWNGSSAVMPSWVKEALVKHFTQWLDTDDADGVVERLLSQSEITVTVNRASAEVRRDR